MATLLTNLGDDSHEEMEIGKSVAHDPLSARTVTNVKTSGMATTRSAR